MNPSIESFPVISSVPDGSAFIVALAEHARSFAAERIQFITGNSRTEIRFFGPIEAEPIHISRIPNESVRMLHLILSERAFLWPDVTDNLFATNARRRRILLAPIGTKGFMADVILEQPRQKSAPALVLEKIAYSGFDPFLDRLSLSESNRAFLESFVTNQHGLAIVHQTGKPGVIDAAAILLALRPDAILYSEPRDPQIIDAILKQSREQLVIVGLKSEDPLDLIFEFQGLLSGSREQFEIFSQNLLLSHVHKRVRRVCGNCARQTDTPSSALDQLPLYLAPTVEQAYLFGRGCALCGHATYRGSVGLDSIAFVNDSLRRGISSRTSIQEIAQAAYRSGMRTLIEDGLDKIGQGLSSYEEVLSVARRPSEALGSIIAEYRHKKSVPAKPTPVRAEPIVQHDEEAALPVDDFFATPSSPTTAARPTPAPVKSNGKGNLLVIEDDEDQRAVLEMVFRNEGYTVYAAQDGRSGMQLLEGESIDVVVCDLMMPGMSGDELVRAIRKHPKLKNTPVLILTAIDTADQEFTSLEFGADDYVAKTVKRKVLLKRVEKLFARRTGKNPIGHLLD